MRLNNFEIEVLKVMIGDRLTSEKWNIFLSNYTVNGYEYTGSGYYLKIKTNQIGLKNEVIHEPIITAEFLDWMIGFLLHIEDDYIVIECYSSGENPPKNFREFDFKITNLRD